MSDYTPDVEGYVLSLRRPLMAMAEVEMPPPTDPFDIAGEIELQTGVLEAVLKRIPGPFLDNLRNGVFASIKAAKDPDMRRARKRHATILFDHLVSRGLKPFKQKQAPEPTHYEQLALRCCVYSLLATIVPDDGLIQANQTATEGWMSLPEPDKAPRDQAVLSYMFQAESKLYMEVMDSNGTTERFLARQPGRAH